MSCFETDIVCRFWKDGKCVATEADMETDPCGRFVGRLDARRMRDLERENRDLREQIRHLGRR